MATSCALWNLLQIYGDPEAADVVFTSGANIVIIGINITTQVKLTGEVFFIKLHLFVSVKWYEKLSVTPANVLSLPYPAHALRKNKVQMYTEKFGGCHVMSPATSMWCVGHSIIADDDLLEIKESKGKHAQFIYDICKFYRDWHVKSDGVYGN